MQVHDKDENRHTHVGQYFNKQKEENDYSCQKNEILDKRR